jgi:pimeloyl-ACP methyl ester carboxylesterase
MLQFRSRLILFIIKLNTQRMKNKLLKNRFLILSSLIFMFMAIQISGSAQVKNIVLVHGAFADGSGYKGLYEILTKKGYKVTVVQNPLTSLEDDVDATNRVLDKQDGPVILVGHSWGGSVITVAGMNPKVVALVYICAYQPDKGETTMKWVTSLPPSSENGIEKPDANGFLYFGKEKFHAGFCADLSSSEADFMYASQGPVNVKCFLSVLPDAAWHTKHSYAILGTEDKAIIPELQRNMYSRSKTKVTESKGSHVIFISHPEIVAKVIMDAAQ